MKNIDRLQILQDLIKNITNDSTLNHEKEVNIILEDQIKISTDFGKNFEYQIKLEFNKVLLFYKRFHIPNKSKKTILEVRNIAFSELVVNLLLIRLPAWKEGMSRFKPLDTV